jgi:1,4-dihydroxy-2-naphthoyl-CoA synthase
MVPGNPGAQPHGDRHRQALVQADSDSIRGIGGLGIQALALYYGTEESHEGVASFMQKRKPRFRVDPEDGGSKAR